MTYLQLKRTYLLLHISVCIVQNTVPSMRRGLEDSDVPLSSLNTHPVNTVKMDVIKNFSQVLSCVLLYDQANFHVISSIRIRVLMTDDTNNAVSNTFLLYNDSRVVRMSTLARKRLMRNFKSLQQD